MYTIQGSGYMLRRALPFLLIPLLLACRTSLNSDLEFHELALSREQRPNADKSFLLPFDAYIIGVEKANRRLVGKVAECNAESTDTDCLDFGSPFYAQDAKLQREARELLAGQHRPTFVSHIARFRADTQPEPCFIYNIYGDHKPCGQSPLAAAEDKSTLVARSWKALDSFEQDARQLIGELRPTHIVVYVMGWNTQQWEAMQNYRDLFGMLTQAGREAGAGFRPLFIGITWPSTGTPAITASDFGIKAKDADEVGLTWANIVINRALYNIKRTSAIPVIVVGHSFGARVSSRAVFSAPLLRPAPAEPSADLLVGLQGAYSYQRFIPQSGTEGSPYRDYARQAGKVVLTSSTADTAVTAAFHKDYFVGSSAVYEITRRPEYSAYFEHAAADSTGRVADVPCDSNKIEYIDASSVINQNQPGTGGGAHSFIYTPEIGRLVFQHISACTKAAVPSN